MMNKLKKTIIILVITLFTLNITSICRFGYGRQVYANSIDEKYSVMLGSAADKIDSWVQGKEKILDTARTYVTSHNKKQVEAQLAKIIKNNKDISDIYVGYEDGSFIDGSGWIPLKSYDVRKRPWYIQSKAAKKIYLSDAYMDLTIGGSSFTAAYPLKDNKGKFKGVISEDIKLTDIVNSLKNNETSNEDGISTFLIDSHGTVLSHSDKKLIGVNMSLKPDYQKILPEIENNESGHIPFSSDGNDNELYYKRIPSTNWIVVFSVTGK